MYDQAKLLQIDAQFKMLSARSYELYQKLGKLREQQGFFQQEIQLEARNPGKRVVEDRLKPAMDEVAGEIFRLRAEQEDIKTRLEQVGALRGSLVEFVKQKGWPMPVGISQ